MQIPLPIKVGIFEIVSFYTTQILITEKASLKSASQNWIYGKGKATKKEKILHTRAHSIDIYLTGFLDNTHNL